MKYIFPWILFLIQVITFFVLLACTKKIRNFQYVPFLLETFNDESSTGLTFARLMINCHCQTVAIFTSRERFQPYFLLPNLSTRLSHQSSKKRYGTINSFPGSKQYWKIESVSHKDSIVLVVKYFYAYWYGVHMEYNTSAKLYYNLEAALLLKGERILLLSSYCLINCFIVALQAVPQKSQNSEHNQCCWHCVFLE